MTIHAEHGTAIRSNPITMLPRVPAAMLEASLFEGMQSDMDGVLVMDAARNIVLVDHRAERILGYPANFLLEKPLDILLAPRSVKGPRTSLNQLGAVRTRNQQTNLELRAVRADGAALTLKARITHLKLGSGIYLALILHSAATAASEAPAISIPSRRRAVTTQQASEVEKRRFSRKLYDDIGQRLSVLKLDLSWLENSLHRSSRHVPARLAEMQGLLDNVITLTKSMASTLRPPVLDDFGLLPAVEWMLESFRKRTAIHCVLEHSGMDSKLDDAPASAVFRVIQEALVNIERHAHAGRTWVVLSQKERRIEVRIRDNGIGLEHDSIGKPGCYGLIAMQERIFVLGGTIRIGNARPHGVQIDASIPLEPIYPTDPSLPISLSIHDTNRNRR